MIAPRAEPWHPVDMTERIATCASGQLRVACRGEPMKASPSQAVYREHRHGWLPEGLV